MANKKKADTKEFGPPTKEIVGLIKKRLGKELPGSNVQVLYLWSGGKQLLYFSWSGKTHRHRAKPFKSEVSRIAIALKYDMLQEQVTKRVNREL